jgi:hypothetical protein
VNVLEEVQQRFAMDAPVVELSLTAEPVRQIAATANLICLAVHAGPWQMVLVEKAQSKDFGVAQIVDGVSKNIQALVSVAVCACAKNIQWFEAAVGFNDNL